MEYSNKYPKTSGSLLQYYRHEPALINEGVIVEFADNNTTALFKFKEKITGWLGNDGTKNVVTMVPLK